MRRESSWWPGCARLSRRCAKLDLPVPLLATYPTADLPLSVGVDQELGARLATRHLLSLGHERVIHVRGPKGWIDADDRASGWRKELRSSGATGRTISGDWTPRSGYEAGREIARDDSVTAVFVANDQMALGVQLALHEAGRRCPTTSAWLDSTTCRKRVSTSRRSPPFARTSASSVG